ncbi:MAG: hypothetical protein GC156_00890 [Actinomycetales bacterium]|nr:hypothetical protein [Actinomycetales bacterium]
MTAVGLTLLVLALAAFATRWLDSAFQPVVVAATFAYLALLPAALGLAVLALGGTGLWLLALAAILGMLVVEVQPWVGQRTQGKPVLRVITANVWFGGADPEAILQLARVHEVDLLALQETTPEFLDGLAAAGAADLFPHSLLAPGPAWQGAALWSRLPLRHPVITERGTIFRVEATVTLGDVESPDDPQVASVHVHAPWPGASGPWLEQLAELEAQLRASERPVILAGDFNATLDHRPFRRLLRAAADASVSARTWWIRTWPAYLPVPAVIAIDHVLLRGFGARSVTAHRVPGSDHAALVVTLTRD